MSAAAHKKSRLPVGLPGRRTRRPREPPTSSQLLPLPLLPLLPLPLLPLPLLPLPLLPLPLQPLPLLPLLPLPLLPLPLLPLPLLPLPPLPLLPLLPHRALLESTASACPSLATRCTPATSPVLVPTADRV